MNPILEYKNLLNKHGSPDTPAVKAFKAKHAEDAVFLRRAKVLEELFLLKKELVVSAKEG